LFGLGFVLLTRRGAIAYRIDGPSIPNTGLTLQAGSFVEGSMPRTGGYTSPLNGNNQSWTFAPSHPQLVCSECTLAIPIDNPGNDAEYKITSIYPGNFADYQQATAAKFEHLEQCSISLVAPVSVYAAPGSHANINGAHLFFVDRVHFIMLQRGDWFPSFSNISDNRITVDVSGFSPLQGDPPYYGVFSVHTPAGWCMSDYWFEVLAGTPSVPTSTPTSTPPPPRPTTGALSVSVGFTEGEGETCQGQALTTIQPQNASGNVGVQSQVVFFSGVAEPQTVSGVQTRGCIAAHLFGNLAPGVWTVRGGSPGGASAACVGTVTAGQFTSVLVWDLRCF
jgi:hypothetical protein